MENETNFSSGINSFLERTGDKQAAVYIAMITILAMVKDVAMYCQENGLNKVMQDSITDALEKSFAEEEIN